MITRVNIKRKAVPALAAITLLLGLSGTGTAQAVTVFSENFEGYTTFPTGSGSNARNEGIPKLLEGAQEAWYAARFQPGNGSIDSDIAVLTNGGGSNTTNVGRLEDDAGLLFKLNTTGLDSVNLSFNWGTASTSSSDKLVVGYHIGPISGFGTCSGNGEAGCFANLRASSTTPLPWYTTETTGATTLTGNWTQLLSGNSPVTSASGGWQSASFLLPDAVENNSEVWFALWLNNGNQDFGLIDNVLVTAVPEVDTWAMMAAGLGLIGFSVRRRQQN